MNNYRLGIKKTRIRLRLKTDPEKKTARSDISRVGYVISRLILCISRLGLNISQ